MILYDHILYNKMCVCDCPGPGLCPCQLCSDGDRVVATGALEALMFNGGPMKFSAKWIYCNTYCRYHVYIYMCVCNVHNIIYSVYNHHPFKATFQGGTIPECKIHFLQPPLKCKICR